MFDGSVVEPIDGETRKLETVTLDLDIMTEIE
jgi:hypothetical protein